MRKFMSQITVAFVCAFLGFMVAYQFKILSKQDKALVPSKTDSDITVEISQLKKQKDELQKKVDETQKKLQQYEEAAVGSNDVSKEIKEELDTSRALLGNTDVEGPGIIVYITPKEDFLRNNQGDIPIVESDLVAIVNQLNSGGAEAVSINDIRITSRTGIKTAGNTIVINNKRISPFQRVVVKAIGDKNTLSGVINFQGAIPPELYDSSDVKIETKDKIKVFKYSKSYNFEYAKPIQ